MQRMKFFIDTHDAANGTFPAGITKEQFAGFYAQYEEACRAEGAISLRTHAGFTMAPDADTVARAHKRVGLAFDTITEVVTSTPGDLFFAQAA
jgi:hypothetical protein